MMSYRHSRRFFYDVKKIRKFRLEEDIMANKNLSRRDFLKLAGVSAAGGSIFGCGKSEQIPAKGPAVVMPAARKPNIIYILADDLGYGDLSCYGQKKFRTPSLDKMAEEGMRFTQHYSGSTVCAPSRCVLLTGYHTGHSYIRGNAKGEDRYELAIPADTLTVAKILKQAGYSTGCIGKWGLGGPKTEGQPNKQGFDHFFGYLGQMPAHFYYPEHLWRNSEKVLLDGKTYSHDLIAKEAIDFIRQNHERPFFLYLAFTIPHAELAVPEDSMKPYKGKFDEKEYIGQHYGNQKTPKAAFAGMVSRMDRDVGRIMGLLRELGIDNNTIVMFSSDNGPHKEGGAEPQYFKSSGPLRGIKRDLYEGGIRVPMIARWPGRIKAGTVNEHISAFWDFLPTCCELSDVKVPKGIDGISFVPTLLGRKQKQHEYMYWEFYEQRGKQVVRLGDWKGMRLNVRKDPDGPIELYNLKDDIGESNNVAGKHLDIVEKVRNMMKAARTESTLFSFQ
jgi:arylsulfatase A